MKRGFSLIEIIIVLGIFGILMVVGSEFFISTIRNDNRFTVENEVRQNAQNIMQDMVSEIRQADSYTITSGGDLITSSVSGKITYHLDSSTGSFYKNNLQVSSNTVAVGISLTPNTNGAITIGLTVQQKSTETRPDFKVSTTLTSSAMPRTY